MNVLSKNTQFYKIQILKIVIKFNFIQNVIKNYVKKSIFWALQTRQLDLRSENLYFLGIISYEEYERKVFVFIYCRQRQQQSLKSRNFIIFVVVTHMVIRKKFSKHRHVVYQNVPNLMDTSKISKSWVKNHVNENFDSFNRFFQKKRFQMHYGHKTLKNGITIMGVNFRVVFEPWNTSLETNFSQSVLVSYKRGSKTLQFWVKMCSF